MKAWYYQESPEDPREAHHFKPEKWISKEQLENLGVFYKAIDVTKPNFMDEIEELCKERDYKNRDEITISKEKLPNYDEKIKMFFEEHLHFDEEIRFCLEGSGYFDVRSKNDEWIRIQVVPGDLVILPAGIYHRFILTTDNYIKAMRLFKEEPKWTPYNRSSEVDETSYRVEYVNQFLKPVLER